MTAPSILRRLALLVACAALAACGGGASTDALIASAKTYLGQHNQKAAIIELKNALQKQPDSAEARFLLGRALLDSGDATAAVVELGKAADLKYPPVTVLPLLARAMNAAGQSKKLIDAHATSELADPAAAADLKTSLAQAHAALGQNELSDRALAAALALAPDSPAARLFSARKQAGRGDLAGALATSDAVLAEAPSDVDAWLLKGDLLWHTRADAAGAADAYRRALALQPNHLAAQSSLITVLLDSKQFDAAAAQLAEMKKLWPNSRQARWFDARIALQKGDPKEARKIADQLLAAAPGDARLLYVAGAADFMAGTMPQAQNSLGKALQAAPDNPAPRKLLARTELRLGQAARALAVIQPLSGRADADGESLSIAAQAHLLAGDTEQAQALFARAAQANPADLRSRTALALTKLLPTDPNGDGSAALGELRDIAAADKGTTADLGLISALVRRKEFDAALAAVQRLGVKLAGSPMVPYLQGLVNLGRQDMAAARASFEKSLALDAKYVPSAARLAEMAMADKQPELARKQFERVLAADPKNPGALLALAELRGATGGSKDEVAEMLAQAIKVNPSNAATRARLVDLHLRNGAAKAALDAAREGVAALPDDPRMLDALGTAQLATGDLNQARASYNQLATLQPNSPLPHLRLADVAALAKNDTAALQSLSRAAALAPGAIPIQRRLVPALLSAGKAQEALVIARATQKRAAQDPAGYAFEGDVEWFRNNLPASAAAYRSAQSKRKSSEVAVKLHTVLLQARRNAEADQVAAQWLAEAPKDALFIAHLGDVALLAKDYATAEARFRDALRIQPDEPTMLNNVAWLMNETRQTGALAYAEKANALRPDQPPFLDTLATVLAADNQLGKAIDTQKKAVALRPDGADLRLNLARLYARNGNTELARRELERLTMLGNKFTGHAEVLRLLRAL